MESYRIFLNSFQNKPLDLSDETWVEIYCELFKVVHLLQREDSIESEEFKKGVYLLAGKILGQNLFYLPTIMRYLYDLIELDLETQKEKNGIYFCLDNIWNFFVFIFSLNSSHEVMLKDREVMIGKLNTFSNEKRSNEDVLNEMKVWGENFQWKENLLL